MIGGPFEEPWFLECADTAFESTGFFDRFFHGPALDGVTVKRGHGAGAADAAAAVDVSRLIGGIRDKGKELFGLFFCWRVTVGKRHIFVVEVEFVEAGNFGVVSHFSPFAVRAQIDNRTPALLAQPFEFA